MSQPDSGEPAARSPLPGLPPLDPVPWTGTAAPGNTGRPYGQRAEAAVAFDARARQAVLDGPLALNPTVDPATAQGAGQVAGQSAGRSGRAPVATHRPVLPVAGTPQADRRSARLAGRRALRVALLGLVLGFLALAAVNASPALARVAGVVAVLAAVGAVVSGIAALRRAHRQHVGSGPAALATVLGAVGLLIVLVVGVVYLSFPTEFRRYVSCARSAAGSEQQTQICEQQFLDSTEHRVGGG